ncbi:sulfite exporter TauE/SafE family protein 3-like isoform X2 [Primulina huaijiensis]|uniref:sulfite exporter TauE/SafE family protein 3-like isoform X2 n=1 Tax=Primulina huaijiensis TaxID=1492673 RepID=UPI003CC793EC
MAMNQPKWKAFGRFCTVVWSFMLASIFVSADRSLKKEFVSHNSTGFPSQDSKSDFFRSFASFLWQADKSGYQHVWPDMAFNWRIIVGTIVGFLGAAFGSVGGVGGGGIFVPMLTLIVGFDSKSSTAISKCMIMGAAISTVYYNLKLRHPTIEMPIIDYDLAVLIQPMLMMGISIGVTFNVIFADWMVTVLLIILFIGTSTKAFLKGIETWKKETIFKKENAKRFETDGSWTDILPSLLLDVEEQQSCFFSLSSIVPVYPLKLLNQPCSFMSGKDKDEAEYNLLPGGPSDYSEKVAKDLSEAKVKIIENVRWKEFGLLVFVWVSYLALQITKNYTFTCSAAYWVVNLMQIPVSFGVSGYQAICLYKGWRKIESKGAEGANLQALQLIAFGFFGVVAGIVGGLLGLGGGFIMGPLFLELGIPPQVSSATATFTMMFSSSMSAIEYYLLKRFPVPYALYFVAVAAVAALAGQHAVRRLIIVLGKASIIIFILAFTIFVSAVSLA